VIPSKTLEDLGWGQLVEHLSQRAHTERGAAALRALEFCATAEEARARGVEIHEARRLTAAEAPLAFGGIRNVLEVVLRADKGGILEASELLAVAETAQGCARLRRHVRRHADVAPHLAAIAERIEDLGHVYHPILESFDDEGVLVDHASDDLGALRRRARKLEAELDRRAEALVSSSRLEPYVQDTYFTQRDDRYVLPIKVESRFFVKGIVHGTSQSGQTLFLEPEELVDLNNSLKLAECEVEEEERRILALLTGYVAEEREAFSRALEATTKLDQVAAGARLADDIEANPPVIAEEEEGFELRQVRHPLMLLAGRPCVANDIAIAPRSALILSGPNAGGKTVALKTVGLTALMTRAGLHVAADSGSRVPWFDSVESDIGDSQSLEKDLSTFSAHLLQLNRVLKSADASTLVLIDEIAVGTEPEQGAALAEAVLETLVERGVPTLVTTHYERLKALAAADARFANASVGFDLDEMKPTFRLHLGIPGSSGALQVARRLGLEAEVAARAEALLGEGRASVEDLLSTLADQRHKLEETCARAESDREAARTALRAAEAERRAAKAERKRAHRDMHGEAVAALRRARAELDSARVAVKRRRKDGEQLRATGKEVDRLAGEIAEHAPEGPPPPGLPARAEDLTPGTAVFVTSLGGRGHVVAAPARGKVTVQVGRARATASLTEVRLDPSAPSRPAQARKQRQEPRGKAAERRRGVALVRADDEGRAPARTRDTTLDLRGERVDAALAALERYIDESLLVVRDVVFVIHGHGTGALRNAVREHVQQHAAVEKWRAGKPTEGGDGITVLWLDVS
jgi:DNA mismatch repair protein MutS2